VLRVDETISISDITRMVEEKKQISLATHNYYMTCPDGKKVEGVEEKTMANFKQIEKVMNRKLIY
jgi:hypothetical protein